MIGRVFRRIWYLLNRRRFEQELEREMAAHRAELGEAGGFGSTLRLREQASDVWGWAWLDDLWHDLRYGARQLRRTPGFALVAIVTLAIGIGVNTAAFGLVNAMLFSELPVPDPDRLRQLEWAGERGFSEPAFRYLRDHAGGWSSLTCLSGPTSATLEHDGQYDRTWAGLVSGEFARTFGATTTLGRPLSPTDDRPGAAPVAVISHEMWQRVFGAAAAAIGSDVTVNDVPVTIVGVFPRGFSTSRSSRPPDVTLAIGSWPRARTSGGLAREPTCRIVGRLAPGRSEEQARQESEIVLRRSGLAPPTDRRPPALRMSQLRLLRAGRGIDELRSRDIETSLPAIAGVTFLLLAVLVVPCANIAGILLARALTRRQEIAARLALGASRRRIVRQLLTEGALLAALSGTCGVALAQVLLLTVARLDSGPAVRLDLSVLAATAAICTLATLSFALAPALSATRGDLASRLREPSAGSPSRFRRAPGSVLVAVQVVVSCVLLVTSGLQSRSLLSSMARQAVEPERLLLFQTSPGTSRASARYVEDALLRLGGVASVVAAGAVSSNADELTVCESASGSSRREVTVRTTPVSPGYFATMKIPVVRGRDVSWSDSRSGEGDGVAVINESLARWLFERVDPIGRRLPLQECWSEGSDPSGPVRTVRPSPRVHGSDSPLKTDLSSPVTIVGVVADDASEDGASRTVYLPFHLLPADRSESTTFAVRSIGNAATIMKPVLQVMQPRETGIPIARMQTQADMLRQRLRDLGTLTLIYVLLGLIATGQAAFGLYGTLSQFMTRRVAEIGLRMVLGAGAWDVLGLVIRQTLTPVAVGLLIGLASSPLVARVMEAAGATGKAGVGQLLVIAAGTSTVMLAAFAVASTPVWRAVRIEPAAALREE